MPRFGGKHEKGVAVAKAKNRHDLARELTQNWIDQARAGVAVDPTKYKKERAILEDLIPVKAAGFRGVVLTAIVGKAIDPSYDCSNDFYASNPRTLFEKGIYYALRDSRVPSGKSDPLNVAKNAQHIDEAWATGRRPESAAMAAVAYTRLIQENWGKDAYRDDLIALFFARLWQYAELLAKADVPLAVFEGTAPVILASKLARFTANFPEGGATPQLVVGTLIEKLREGDAAFKSVGGVHESVFGTNTTSKKPADVWEEIADGSIGQLFEITAKPVDEKRLDDCVEALRALDLGGRVVTFICRLPQDIATLAVVDDTLLHQDTMFQFVDIDDYVRVVFCALPTHRQSEVIAAVDEFVKDTNRKIAVKNGWGELFG